MPVDHIRYDILTQEALRGVVRTVLRDAAKNGPPGEHHFYISFDTRADGVRLSPRMLAQYPEEMTVVLQHQFWDLVVTEDGFEVGLSFGGIPERLAIPFAAIKGFLDPSVQFGLQFGEMAEPEPTEEIQKSEGQRRETKKEKESATTGKDRSVKRPPAEHKGTPTMAAVPVPANPEPANSDSTNSEPTNSEPTRTASGKDPDKPASGGEVVRLDRFRKK